MPTLIFASDNQDYLGYQGRISEIYNTKKDAVVRVLGQYDNPSAKPGQPKVQIDVATGFFISREGLVMTVANIAEKAQQFGIEHQGTIYKANLIGYDSYTNIAILSTTGTPRDLPFVQLSDTLDIPSVSTLLLGITCKIGLDPGPSTGMVTGHHTAFLQKPFPSTYLRTSIPSDGGEGGSPIFDLNGRFIGMMAISVDAIRSSFVIPSKAIIRIRDDLLFSGRASYAYLGIELDREASSQSNEIVIGSTVKGGPADAAGVKQGDHILEFNGSSIAHVSDLHNATFFARPGQYSSMKVLRNGSPQTLSVKIQEQPIEQLAALASKVSNPKRILASQVEKPQPPTHSTHTPTNKSNWSRFFNHQ